MGVLPMRESPYIDQEPENVGKVVHCIVCRILNHAKRVLSRAAKIHIQQRCPPFSDNYVVAMHCMRHRSNKSARNVQYAKFWLRTYRRVNA
mmetsp:Transcript_20120/g.31934  ORF Transcript_20120/g.31934 Transcript_20120/m.31934 type:complete len:91 (+) Transcript_20120:143-415(+)